MPHTGGGGQKPRHDTPIGRGRAGSLAAPAHHLPDLAAIEIRAEIK